MQSVVVLDASFLMVEVWVLEPGPPMRPGIVASLPMELTPLIVATGFPSYLRPAETENEKREGTLT